MSSRFNCFASVLVFVAVGSAARGQGINMDIGSFHPAPASSYGGAPGQVGAWNNFGGPTTGVALFDLAGAPSPVSVSTSVGGDFTFNFDNVLTAGDDELLLDDGCDGALTMYFSGLANGLYDVYTYAWAPDSPGSFFTNVAVVGSLDPVQLVGGQDWTGGHVWGSNFAQHRVAVTAGTLQIDCTMGFGFVTVNGVQLVPVNTTPAVYCTAKLNSLGCLPAIGFTGSSSAAAASGFTLRAANVRNKKQGVLLYGLGGRVAVPFQGGLRCVGAPLARSIAFDSGGTPLPANDCTGVYALDLNAFAAGSLGGSPAAFLREPGTIVDVQFWGRDDGFPAPDNTTLSDALEYVVGL